MSTRQNRREKAALISERVQALRDAQSRNEQELQALTEAQAALEAEPVERTEAVLTVNYAPENVVAYRATCSECDEVFLYSKGTRFCPFCSSAVTRTQQDTSPVETLQRNAVASAVRVLTH